MKKFSQINEDDNSVDFAKGKYRYHTDRAAKTSGSMKVYHNSEKTKWAEELVKRERTLKESKVDWSTVTHHTGKSGYDAEKHPFVVHKDREYSRTGKTGKNVASGEDSWEYSHRDEKAGVEHRLWMTKSGKVHED